MKLNNKGITLTEIIISIALISIVLIFLFSLLVTVNDINEESKVNSTYLITKSLIIKNIESDLIKSNFVKINSCDVKDIYQKYGDNNGAIKYFSYEEKPNIEVSELKAKQCIKLVYDGNESLPAYLGIFYYKNKNSYVITYIHDDVRATRELHDFEKNPYNISRDINNKINTWTLNGNPIPSTSTYLTGFSTIKIPIIDSNGKDYSIIISYYA